MKTTTVKTEFKNVIQLLDYFKSEEKCKALLAQQRWAGNPICPHCGAANPYIIKDRGYKCSDNKCYKKFSVTVGTIFENSKIKLRYWFAAIYLCTAHKKGISSHQLARDLGITQKSAWFVLARVREMLQDKAPQTLSNVVEIDETYIGGKEKNKHKGKRKEKTQGGANKVAVLGILERDGNLVTKVTGDTKKASLLPVMVDTVAPGTTVYTDEKSSYRSLKNLYQHDKVIHANGEYVRGVVHTNTIEGFWSLLKRGIDGIYHQVSPQHLQSYCNEFAFRYNFRTISDNERFFYTLTKSGNFVLPYKKLIDRK